MPLNRLRLDWSLSSRDDRKSFLDSYLPTLYFSPNEHELETLANYLLWGKNQSGLNGRQEGLDIKTSHQTWDSTANESLDALIDSPTFNENLLRPLDHINYTTPHTTFSRSEARATSTPIALPSLEDLWRRIDETDLLIEFYDLDHNRRKLPIRESLLSRFTQSELDSIRARAAKFSLRQYLQNRHYLVDLYREQYSLKDTYTPTIQHHNNQDLYVEDTNSFAIGFAPLDFSTTTLLPKLLPHGRLPEPADFSENELREISRLIWAAHDPQEIDFRNTSHIYTLISFLESNQFPNPTLELGRNILAYYTSIAGLKPHQRILLEGKLAGTSNQDISDRIAEECGHRYTLNYISTIYCKTIVPMIAAAAVSHYEVCQNLFFPENFKTCIDCGRVLLRNETNFMHKTKVKDGFSPRCKICEKIKRDLKKVGV